MVQNTKIKVTTAAVINKDVFSARLPDETAIIFSSEAKAIRKFREMPALLRRRHF